MFKELSGCVAVTAQNGVYQQVPVFARGGYLYAKNGSGFVRVYADGSTSKAKCFVDTLHVDTFNLYRDRLGRLCDASVDGAQPLPSKEVARLLGHA